MDMKTQNVDLSIDPSWSRFFSMPAPYGDFRVGAYGADSRFAELLNLMRQMMMQLWPGGSYAGPNPTGPNPTGPNPTGPNPSVNTYLYTGVGPVPPGLTINHRQVMRIKKVLDAWPTIRVHDDGINPGTASYPATASQSGSTGQGCGCDCGGPHNAGQISGDGYSGVMVDMLKLMKELIQLFFDNGRFMQNNNPHAHQHNCIDDGITNDQAACDA